MVIELFNNVMYILQFIIVALLCFRMKHRITVGNICIVGITVIIATIFLYNIEDIGIQMPISVLYIYIVMRILYDEKKLFLFMYTIAMTAALSLLNLMSDMIVMSTVSIVTDSVNKIAIYNIYASIISILFLIIVGVVVTRGSNQGIKKLGWKYIILFSVLLIVDSIVVLALGDLAFTSFEKNTLYKVMYILVVIGIFIQLVMVIWFMLSREVYREKELITKKYLNEQLEHYTYLENRERETKKFRHDIRKHMHMLTLFHEKQDFEMFNQYMEEINGKIDQLGNKISVENGIVDAILNQYYDDAQKTGICLNVTGRFPATCVISAYDLCTVFSNLLSNAIRAELDYGGDEIFVCCKHNEKEIIIEVVNDYKTIMQDEKGRLISSKDNKQNHGFGLENVIECVERNQGDIIITTENERFRVLLSMVNI